MSNEVITLESVVYSVAEVFDEVLVDKSINFKRESEFALQILYGNDYSRKIALANPQSVRDAVTNIAAIGISLNPAKKQAYLVPRDNKICLDLAYGGLLELAVASGSILWAKADLVREADAFVLMGLDKPPAHTYNPFAKDRGAITGVYVVAKTRDGDYLTDTMAIDEVYAIRDRSSAWKAWIEKKKRCPWVTDEGEMIKKTVIKRAYKMWPKTDRLDNAIHYLNTDGGQGIDFSTEPSHAQPSGQAPAFSVGNILARIDGAETMEQVAAIRREGLTAASREKDKAAYDRITVAVKRKRAELSKNEATDVVVKEAA